MSENKDLNIDREGNFYRWQEILKAEDKVIGSPATAGTIPETGHISGVEITKLLKNHIGKTVRITVEVKNES